MGILVRSREESTMCCYNSPGNTGTPLIAEALTLHTGFKLEKERHLNIAEFVVKNLKFAEIL